MTVNEQTNRFLIVASVFSTLTQVKPNLKRVIMKWSAVSVSGHTLCILFNADKKVTADGIILTCTMF